MPPLETAEPAAEAPSLRDTIEAASVAVAAAEPKPVTVAPAPAEKSAAEPAEARTEPQKTEEKPYLAPEEKPAPESKEEPHVEPKTEPAEGTTADRAPKSWKPDARAKWEATDPSIRAEVVRREREITRALGESTGARNFTKSFQEAVSPFAERYKRSGLEPIQTVVNLMQADHLLATAPMEQRAKFMAKMIKDYGIDIALLDAAVSGGDPSTEPVSVVERMINERLAPLAEFVQTNKSAEQQRQQAEMDAQIRFIESMAEDDVNYPHFETVRLDMSDIIEMNARRGVYLSPKDAYTRAVAMNPEARAAEQVRTEQTRATKAHEAATRSLDASLSVSGNPASLRQAPNPDDLRGTITAAIEALSR